MIDQAAQYKRKLSQARILRLCVLEGPLPLARRVCRYLAKISSVNVLGIIAGRGRGFSAVGAGAGPRSAVTV